MDVEAAKQAALEVCIAKVTERYGSVTTKTKLKKKRIGKISGYVVAMNVDKTNRRINCLADGETLIYR